MLLSHLPSPDKLPSACELRSAEIKIKKQKQKQKTKKTHTQTGEALFLGK